MKKNFLRNIFVITVFFSAIGCSYADSYMSMPDLMNSRMFSTEGSRPLTNLERTHFENQQIMKIEEKQNPRKKDEQDKNTKEISDKTQEKTKFKDYFKNFVFEW